MTDLATLTKQWDAAKKTEQQATDLRISIESEIYELLQNELPDQGTFTAETGMKISIGYSEAWSQEKLNAAYQVWDASVPFPFTGTWKPDGKAISYLRDNLPEAYKTIQLALTLKPRKPSFSIKDE